ncbi:phosphate acyltransferase, partial [Actinomyces sp. F1_1611]
MSSRILVMGTGSSPLNAQLVHEISQLLAAHSQSTGGQTFSELDAFAGLKFTRVIADPNQALAEVAVSIRSNSSDTVLIKGVEGVPAPSFDVTGWNLDVAANTGAQVLALIDGTGMNAELIEAEAAEFGRRAARHHATVGGLVVSGARGLDFQLGGIPAIEPPLSSGKLAEVTGADPSVVTPLMFQGDLLARASANRKTIVLPEPEDDRVLRATAELLAAQVANIVLVGEAGAVQARADQLGLDISGARIVSPHQPDLVEKYAAEFARLRAKKGVTLEQARAKVQDVTYFATMMV